MLAKLTNLQKHKAWLLHSMHDTEIKVKKHSTNGPNDAAQPAKSFLFYNLTCEHLVQSWVIWIFVTSIQPVMINLTFHSVKLLNQVATEIFE